MADKTENGRAWVAKMKWPRAKEPFYFGHFFARLNASHQELEEAAFRSIADILDPSFPRPDIIEMHPGMLVFLPEHEERKAA